MIIVSGDGRRTVPVFETLEQRRLYSASYVKFGVAVQPSFSGSAVSYLSKSAPAGDYLIAVAGGSITYKNSVKHPTFRVNDYVDGDFGYKIIQTHARAINAPGLSVPKASSLLASADSVGVYVKFRHSVAGKIGIELLDQPYYDNAVGAAGAPVFILKQRMVKVATAVNRPSVSATSPFSSVLIASNAHRLDPQPLSDQLDG